MSRWDPEIYREIDEKSHFKKKKRKKRGRWIGLELLEVVFELVIEFFSA